MPLYIIVILGIVQGLTEFLPVSSKTHLQFAQHFLGIRESDRLTLTIILHAGSLMAIFLYYWRSWIELLKTRRREMLLVIVASLPAACMGLLFEKKLEQIYGENLLLPALLLPVTGVFLWISDRFSREAHDLDHVPLWKVFVIGVAQSFALLPGISRSGSTIGAGYLCGLRRVDSVRLSFFMGAVTIAGALVLKAKDMVHRQADFGTLPILIGVLVTFGVSLAAIKGVEKLSSKGRFSLFAPYCVTAGVAGMIYHFAIRG